MGDWKLISRENADSDSASTDPPKGRAKKSQKGSDPIELYHLVTDIGETTNVAHKEPERVALMKAKLAEFLKDAVPFGVTTKNIAE